MFTWGCCKPTVTRHEWTCSVDRVFSTRQRDESAHSVSLQGCGGQRSVDHDYGELWLVDRLYIFTFDCMQACMKHVTNACVRSWPCTPFPFVCLNVGLVVPPACTEAPRGAKSCPQTGSWAWPGTCRVLPSLWTASWLWTEGAGGGNQSISVSLSLSLSPSSVSLPLPLQPPRAVGVSRHQIFHVRR